ncbi:long chain fatty alcohol oxidase-like protein [Coleophoma cylindrospora]|uniref:Long-chain-alcohol oxidase n=1 Tax=Coleophoma cylindrospora TaxID=1849047 RepID=A0A3D8SF31_9HELO|nr:long chain fatty alcohol oxidase-like protein [Coleophoma cylindrospora]
MEVLAPLPNPLPEGPEQFFNETQWAMLMAIMDTVIPDVRRETQATDNFSHATVPDVKYNSAVDHITSNVVNPPGSQSLDEYFSEKPSDNPRFQELLKRTLVSGSPEDSKKALSFVLSALNTTVGSVLLTGYKIPFHQQPANVRQSILEGWRASYLPALQLIYKQMTAVARNHWLKTSPLFPKLSGFPAAPEHYKPGSYYEYEFIQVPEGSGPEVMETDVVIVGSGCGGAVCAKTIAEAGYKVLVVEKAYNYKPTQLPMTEEEGGIHLFENGGICLTDDGSVSIVAGSNWGGGGTVNWSASLQTQSFVRREWSEDRGLSFFGTAEFQTCLDRVCHRMGVSDSHVRQNHGNEVILEGSRKLGYTSKAVPQNTGGDEHYCGHCTLGCGSAQKQGPVVAWLPDAAKAGAKFMEGFQVNKVIFDESEGTKKAVGVQGWWTSRNSKGGVDGPASDRKVREVIIKAKRVIISAGTLWSPIILLNSGLKNYQIGRNTYLHPVNMLLGVFKEDVRPWEGGILTSVCSSFEDLDGHGHGVKLEVTSGLPGMALTFLNWTNGFDYKVQALKYRHTNAFISIARDRDTGRIYPDPTSGKPRVQYSPSSFDRANALQGVLALAKICYVSGAIEIHPCLEGVKPFIRKASDITTNSSSNGLEEDIDPGITDPRFAAWLATIEAVGNKPPGAGWFCAHQMGSNRMSAQAKDGVVDPKGRVWGTEALYVSDASVFPSASGVNPMITNMAISDWISRGVVRELRNEGRGQEARL